MIELSHPIQIVIKGSTYLFCPGKLEAGWKKKNRNRGQVGNKYPSVWCL